MSETRLYKASSVTFAALLLTLLSVSCATEERELRLMSYNIRAGRGLDKVFDLERTARVILAADPDFVGLQEVDSLAERTGLIDEAAELGRLTGMRAFFAGAIPYSQGKYGIAILSKEEPLSVRALPLPGAEEERTVLAIEYADLVLLNTHFSLTEQSRLESVGIVTALADEFSKPVVICGDFNMKPGSRAFSSMEERWAALSDTTMRTFPANEPRLTIDYFWGLEGYDYSVKSFSVVDEPVASDHRPLLLTLTLPRTK